ncbi:MAG: Holliday junction branch migration protein RuvA [Desulfobulbaceae bacterium]|nr:Holliday junction branch migration protein RuvA [Desulfobulbaceae bacterium]HIJ78886.1 Holliday junction branch migration protein RuvA [Deltaproteobacteria bacterium]
MIACLTGELFKKLPDTLIINVGGVGYEVFFPQSGHDRLPEVGDKIFLYVQTIVREDALLLYGFISAKEKEMFQVLITVSGVGPKLAHNILSGISPEEMSRAVLADDVARLTRLPGVGKKTAERLCLELKDKVDFIPAGLELEGAKLLSTKDNALFADALSALTNLGYPAARAQEALEIVRQQVDADGMADMRIQELLRHTLKVLA